MALTDSWQEFRYHKEQCEYFYDEHRFVIAIGPRRGGKSDLARRRIAKSGFRCTRDQGMFTLCAPTREHAKRLHWDKFKALIPDKYIARRNGKTRMISEVDLTIILEHNKTQFRVTGLKEFRRAEGDTWDGTFLDEAADMPPMAWPLAVRPSLSTIGRPGTADFIGKPRGKGFYWELWRKAATNKAWGRHHWDGWGLLDEEEMKQAQRDLSKKEFEQEYLAKWVSFAGVCYYPFDAEVHAAIALDYDPRRPLDLCLDFNVCPGIAAVVQPQNVGLMNYNLPTAFDSEIDAVIDEVWIEDNSNTRLVCQRFLEKWANHPGLVRLFGDFTGGNRHTSQTQGTDWELAESVLLPVFGNRLSRHLKPSEGEVPRINALNRRLLSADDTRIRMAVDPLTCPHIVADFETVERQDDGRLDKGTKFKMFTHLTDSLGDRARVLFPTHEDYEVSEPLKIG